MTQRAKHLMSITEFKNFKKVDVFKKTNTISDIALCPRHLLCMHMIHVQSTATHYVP